MITFKIGASSSEWRLKEISYEQKIALLIGLLREVRLKAGITQDELAGRICMRQTDISKVEKGIRRIDAVELMHWVEALDVDLYAFFAEFKRRVKALGSTRRRIVG